MSTNYEIHKCIKSYLDKAEGSTIQAIVFDAWKSVQAYRLVHCGYGQEVVAAEHYLFMRVLGSIATMNPGILTIFDSFIVGYDLYKQLSKLAGIPLYKESDCPPADPSSTVRAWAYTGLCDGAIDLGRTFSLPVAPIEPNYFAQAKEAVQGRVLP